MVCVDFSRLTMKNLRRRAEINHHETFEDAQVSFLTHCVLLIVL